MIYSAYLDRTLRPVYAVRSTKTKQLMTLALTEQEARGSLRVYQQTTAPEHFELVKIKVDYDNSTQEVI